MRSQPNNVVQNRGFRDEVKLFYEVMASKLP